MDTFLSTSENSQKYGGRRVSLTKSQNAAVLQRGNVVVMAGAGTGKTSTLVERCLHCLTDPENRAALDEILMVTFTEAAAAEMRRMVTTCNAAEVSRTRNPTKMKIPAAVRINLSEC